jgi:hypothetical protein
LAEPGRGVLSIVERQALRRGDFASITDLITRSTILHGCLRHRQPYDELAWPTSIAAAAA